MAVRLVFASFLCSLFTPLITDVAALQAEPHGRNIQNPVTLTSVSVNTNANKTNATSVTINYVAVKPVHVVWTVDGGFSPTALDEKASVTTTETSGSVLLPSTLQFEALHVQLICTEELFELHLDLDKSRFSNGTFPTNSYSFYVPPKNEIGLSSRGESQFHIFVNLTGSRFSLGMTAAEVIGKKHGSGGKQLYTHSTFSFLPDSVNHNLRLKKILDTETEKHFDVVVTVPALYKYGGILSLLAACSLPNSVIKRMDMKQTIHLHPKSKPVLPLNFISFLDSNMQPVIKVENYGKSFIRCKAVGNPRPSLTLAKMEGDSVNIDNGVSVQVPTYETSLPFETSKTFQFVRVNASDYGQYACKAENGRHTIYKHFSLSAV